MSTYRLESITKFIQRNEKRIKFTAAAFVLITLLGGFVWVLDPVGSYEPVLFTLTIATSILLALPSTARYLEKYYQLNVTSDSSEINVSSVIQVTKHQGSEDYVSGLWKGNFGLLRLSLDGENIFGEFQYKNEVWIGHLAGKCLNGRLIFHWEWHDESPNRGIGFLDIEKNHLVGRYYHYDEGYSYDDLLQNPNLLDDIGNDKYHYWELFKDY